MGGKNALRLTGFPTPNDMPQDGGYVVFRVPRDNEWAGLILGAAQALSYEYNFYEWGDMTPDQAAEAFRLIVTQAPYETCGCEMPGGRRVIRINAAGHLEQLTDGEWTDPTDDYEVPTVPARTEPTPQERRCLAAANAENVLHLLYEEIADAVAGGASEAEVEALMVVLISSLIGGWLGLAMDALLILAFGLFQAFLAIAEYMTADLWDSAFSDALICYLYDCSEDAAGVVTFDYQCILDKLATYVDLLDPSFINNLRLFGQVAFILNVIGVDGLNAAGATTAITELDCGCDCEVSLIDGCGYGTIEHLGGTRWRVTGNFVDTSWAVCIADVDGKCFGYTNWDVISGAPDYSDFQNCIPAGETGFPSGCTGDPDTGHGSDITAWFMSSNSGSFVVEFDAFCHEDCA